MLFVTSNPGKAREADEIFGDEADVERVDYDCVEIQSDSLAEIAAYSVRDAYDELGEPCFVDDSGLFVEGVGGFPGPYSSYVYSTLGLEGVLRALEGFEGDDRAARFDCVVAYHDGNEVQTFEGTVLGRVTDEPRGEGGFGYDPVFEVTEDVRESGDSRANENAERSRDGENRTFAEMPPDEKNAVSHRRRAFEAFADSLD